MDQIVRLLNGPQGNGVPGQGLALPPVGAGFQREVLPRAGEHVGPRAQGDASRLLDDGDVQQGGQSTVGAAQGDGHHAVGGGDVRHAGEAGGVEGAGAGQVEGGRDLRGRQGAAVGEGHPAAGDKGPLEAVGRHGGGGAERLLGLKLPVQGKQPLIQPGSRPRRTRPPLERGRRWAWGWVWAPAPAPAHRRPDPGTGLPSAGRLECFANGSASFLKARRFSAENLCRCAAGYAPSRGNQFPLDTRLRRDTPSARRLVSRGRKRRWRFR